MRPLRKNGKGRKVEVEKIKRTSVAEKIAEDLIRMVDSGDFAPGETLPPERDLAEMFGVGRCAGGGMDGAGFDPEPHQTLEQ